jgi:predicted ATP-dependent serine protease
MAGRGFRCINCGKPHEIGARRCRECRAVGMVKAVRSGAVFLRAVDIQPAKGSRVATGIEAWDRVLGDELGGGAWLPSTLLLAGPPGHGKSTRALLVGNALARATRRPLVYLSAEMTAPTMRRLAERVGVDLEFLLLNDLPELEPHLATARRCAPAPVCLVFDSLPELVVDESRKASSQATALKKIVETTRELGALAIVIQHVNKEHAIAGTERLQHEVDVVCFIEDDILSTSKNRHGPAPRSAPLPGL